jgi:predicted nucleic acid-binding protein
MSRRVLIDSNVFIEYFKGNPKASAMLNFLLSTDYELFINAIVYSEVVFIFVSSKTGLSARSLKKKPDMVKESGVEKVAKFLEGFKVAEINEVVLQTASKLIEEYGLLPNDAVILATAKVYDMTLATMDSDFQVPSEKENVPIITRASP